MNPQERDTAFELIASLERQISTLETLLNHKAEIEACKKAIDRLKSRLDEASLA